MHDSVHVSAEQVAGPEPPGAPSLRLPIAKPLWTWVFMAINILVWVAVTIVGSSQDPETLIRFGAKVNALIVAGEYWRFITPIFVHSGLLHLVFNLYALYAIGADVERLFGHVPFAALYLISGFGGVLASFAFNNRLSVGASGAIFGLVGALGTYFARHRQAFGQAGRRQLLNIIAITAYNLVFGFLYPGIDNHGHFGGLLTGIALGWALSPDYAIVRDWLGNPLRVVDARPQTKRLLLTLPVVLALLLGATLAVHDRTDSFDLRMEQGELLLDGGDLEGALSAFTEAVRLQPDSAEAHFMQGYAATETGDYLAASKAFERAVQLREGWPEARWNLALTYMLLGRDSDARHELETYLSLPISDSDRQRAASLLADLKPEPASE